MEKKKIHVFNKDAYLLGTDADGINYYMVKESWDCDWYWGLGYVQTYTNNKNPEKSKDINMHTHFDSLFLNGKKNGFDLFNEFFENTPLSNEEIWKLLELMSTAYKLKEAAETFHLGGTHYTSNPCKDIIKQPLFESEINKVMIPALMKEVRRILGEEK